VGEDAAEVFHVIHVEERVYMGSMVYSMNELSEARGKIQLPCP